MRKAVGPDHFFAGIPDDELHLLNLVLDILRNGPAPAASLREIESSDAVLILGEDVTNFAPRMALSLRQSVRQQPMAMTDKLTIPRWLDHAVRELVQDAKGPLFIACPTATRLDDVATATYRAAPDELARLGFAVAHALDGSAPTVQSVSPNITSLAERIVAALRSAQQPLVVSGLGCRSESVIQAAANISRALHHIGRPAKVAFTVPDCNSLGLALLTGRPVREAFAAVRDEVAETVIVLENDLYRRAPAAAVDAFLWGAKHLVVLDHLENATSMKAELVLPAGAFAEADGTLINNEARAQRFFQVFVPQEDVQESWRWLRDGLQATGRREFAAWGKLDDVIATLGADLPALARVADAAPPASFRMAGGKVPREPHRYSGRTAMLANLHVSEPKPPDDPDSPLAFSMEGNPDQPPSALIPFAWSPGWNSYQAWNKFQEEIAGPLRGGNPGVRLIVPPAQPNGNYFRDVPPGFQPRDDEWLIVPLYHIFGSEELSVHSPGVKELSPQAYLAMNEEDANRLGLRAENAVEFAVCGTTYRVSFRIRPDLSSGLAGVSAGIEPLQGVPLPAWSRIVRVS